jgi:hypothetical protein
VTICLSWVCRSFVENWSTQIDSTFYVVVEKILVQAFVIVFFSKKNARRETWIRKIFSLRKLTKQKKRKRLEKKRNILVIRRQFARLTNSMKTFENIARWIVNVLSIVCRFCLIFVNRRLRTFDWAWYWWECLRCRFSLFQTFSLRHYHRFLLFCEKEKARRRLESCFHENRRRFELDWVRREEEREKEEKRKEEKKREKERKKEEWRCFRSTNRCEQTARDSSLCSFRQEDVFSFCREKVDNFVNKLKIEDLFSCSFDVLLKSVKKKILWKKVWKKCIEDFSSHRRRRLTHLSFFVEDLLKNFFIVFWRCSYFLLSFIHYSNANTRVIWSNNLFCCFGFFCQQFFQFFIALRLLFIWMTMSRRSCHLRTLKERRKTRHECLSWLMKNWVYTISCLLIHLSYKDRNTCNSIFWTIWLRWCFLRSKRLYHLFWTRFELFFYCSFSLLFLESVFNVFRRFVSFSTIVRRDLELLKHRFWDFSEEHFQILFLNRTSSEKRFASTRCLNYCCKHTQRRWIIWFNHFVDNWHNFLNKIRKFDFVFRFVRSFANDKRCYIVNVFTNDSTKMIKTWK